MLDGHDRSSRRRLVKASTARSRRLLSMVRAEDPARSERKSEFGVGAEDGKRTSEGCLSRTPGWTGVLNVVGCRRWHATVLSSNRERARGEILLGVQRHGPRDSQTEEHL